MISWSTGHCGSLENVPLRSAAGTMIDWLPQQLPFWIYPHIHANAPLPLGCSHAMAEHDGNSNVDLSCKTQDYFNNSLWLKDSLSPCQKFLQLPPDWDFLLCAPCSPSPPQVSELQSGTNPPHLPLASPLLLSFTDLYLSKRPAVQSHHGIYFLRDQN